MQKKQASEGGVAAVDRALTIVDALAARSEPQTLAELSASTGFYKSTILRLLESLERRGYTARLDDGRYALGPTIFRLGLAYQQANPLGEIVLPLLKRLVADGTESASLHIRHDATSRICVLRVDSSHSTLDRVAAGDILPLDRGAAGRILLAFDGADTEDARRLREDCVALSVGERDPACAGLACPVFGPGLSLKGALSLSGPRERFTPQTIARMRQLLLRAADEVTAALGGQLPIKLPRPSSSRHAAR